MPIRFTSDDDLVLLIELTEIPPCRAEHGESKEAWEELARRVSNSIGRKVGGDAIQRRVTFLVNDFRKRHRKSSKDSDARINSMSNDSFLQEYTELLDNPQLKCIRRISEANKMKEIAIERWKEKNGMSVPEDRESVGIATTKTPSTNGEKDVQVIDLTSEIAENAEAVKRRKEWGMPEQRPAPKSNANR